MSDEDKTNVDLKSATIGAIRTFVQEDSSSRDGLKQLLLDAGADSVRVLAICVISGMGEPGYKSRTDILNEGFDTIWADFPKPEADGIALRLVNIILARKGDALQEMSLRALEAGLAASGLSMSQVLAQQNPAVILDTLKDVLDDTRLEEAKDLIDKCLKRMVTDPPGAITVAVSAVESVCCEAHNRLGLALPNKKQLPGLLVSLRRGTNLEELANVESKSHVRLFTSLSSLAEHAYPLAHELSDRHGHGDDAQEVTPFLLDLMIAASAVITMVIAGALRREELKPKPQIKNGELDG